MQSTSLNMQRKPGFPVANCSIKMPDGLGVPDAVVYEDDNEHQQKRQLLINFGHSQWGFNNWNWAVTKQELDFVDMSNGKYCAGVVAFVSISVKNFDIHRENIGYATSNAHTKGFAIYKSRKCAVTNALRETLLSFGGTVATELLELLEAQRVDPPTPTPAPPRPPDLENNQNIANKPAEAKNMASAIANKPRKEDMNPVSRPPAPVKNAGVANAPRSPPAARAHPLAPPPPPGAPLPPAANRAPPPRAPLPRPSSNDAKLEGMTEEEARAERKRRQRLAQEEFRLKQLTKNGTDDKQELHKNSSSLDMLLMEIPTQDIVIEETGDSVEPRADGKRKSPQPEGHFAKRRASFTKLDILQTD